MKTLLWATIIVMTACAHAIDSKGVLAIVVQVVDESGVPIEGASVTLPQREINNLRDTAKTLGMSALATEHACLSRTTDKLGFALVYYAGGTQSTPAEYACSLPDSLDVKHQGKQHVTVSLSKRGMLSVKPNESVVPYVTVTLSTK